MKYDVVVVGGRIGGSVSSLFASQNGLDVLMIEKRQEIGTPVQCAEGTFHSTFETLEIKPSKKYICSDIKGARIHAPNDSVVKMKEAMYILDRKIFDKHLAIESARAGTDIMVKTTVKDLITKDGKVCGVVAKHMGETTEIKADVVIAADGVESNLARMAGLNSAKNPEEVGSCAQYELVGLEVDDYIDFYFGKEIAPGGYSWIFPKGDGIANVGLGVRNTTTTAYEHLKKFTSRFDATPVELNIGGVPLTGPLDKTYTDGLMVVGDAAGHVDPVSGGGIHIAAACGRIAGEVAANAVKEGDTSSKSLKKYDDLWRDEFGDNLKLSLKYRKIVDKLSDDDMNALAEYFNENNSGNTSKLSTIKFIGRHPHLLKFLKDLI